MTEHKHITKQKFEELGIELTELQDDAIINHIRFSGQHKDSFQNNSRFSDPEWFDQLRAHSLALIKGEVSIEELKKMFI